MTRRDTLVCEHEPFGEPYYYGPERLGRRFENDPEYRENTGFSQATYKDIFDKIEQDGRHVRSPSILLAYNHPTTVPFCPQKIVITFSSSLHSPKSAEE